MSSGKKNGAKDRPLITHQRNKQSNLAISKPGWLLFEKPGENKQGNRNPFVHIHRLVISIIYPAGRTLPERTSTQLTELREKQKLCQ
jgi:hypothetical protein